MLLLASAKIFSFRISSIRTDLLNTPQTSRQSENYKKNVVGTLTALLPWDWRGPLLRLSSFIQEK